ncbi:MAG: hypothetical protein IJ532_07570 [Alphaproteobacteria bacterium]|nr:hypothetical protein [Alphaproteobacteria bacterium]
MNKFTDEVDVSYFENPLKKDELLQMVKDPCVLVAAGAQSNLFMPGYEDILFEYLSHHSLYEANQYLLFEDGNEKVMDFFLEHWVLGSVYEAKLCEPQYRAKWLLKYLEYHNFADSDNEMLLFGEGMDEYRRFYIRQTDFHCREAELKLIEPQYRDDLRLYVELRRRFFKDQIEHFIEKADPAIVELYKQLNKY